MAIYVDNLAAVDPRAELEDEVAIGPFCVVGPKAKIGRGTRLESHVTITGRVTLGAFNRVSPGAVLGGDPQDISYRGTDTEVVIGDHNVIRECVTVNRATEKEDGVTTIGDHNYFMAGSHVAHDCRLGCHIILANAVLLGGHVHVQDFASLSGGVAVHHFATIGRYAFVGGLSRVLHDAPPYMLVDGAPTRPRCINVVALKRHDFTSQSIDCLSDAHRLLFRAKVGLENAREILRNNDQMLPEVCEVLRFVEAQAEGKHGRARERTRRAA